jgi:hypothetical protein
MLKTTASETSDLQGVAGTHRLSSFWRFPHFPLPVQNILHRQKDILRTEGQRQPPVKHLCSKFGHLINFSTIGTTLDRDT